jgi:hypothetical protein
VKTRRDGLAQAVDRVCRALEGVGGDFAEIGFEFGEDLLDGVEVGTIWRQVKQRCAAGFDGFSNTCDLVNTDVVHEQDVASFQGRREDLFDIGRERLAIHRASQHKGSGHAIVAQGGDESAGFPVAMQDFLDQPLAAWRAATETGDIARDAGFIDEDQSLRIKPRLPPSQGLSTGGDVRPILLGGAQTFF